jgi:hypothetical protein
LRIGVIYFIYVAVGIEIPALYNRREVHIILIIVDKRVSRGSEVAGHKRGKNLVLAGFVIKNMVHSD